MMLFPRRILLAVKGLRIPTRSGCHKKYVQTEQDKKKDRKMMTALFVGGSLGGLGFAHREILNRHNYKHNFVERVLMITASGMVGFGVGWFAILLSPIILPIGLVVAALDYFYPPPSETDM